MSHLCLIALVSVLFAGFAEVHAHQVQVEVEGHKEHLSVNVPDNAIVSALVAQVTKEVSEKLNLPEEAIKAIHEKSVQKNTRGKKKGQEKLGNILGGKKNGKLSANKISKVYVKVDKAKANGGKKAHEVHDENDELEAGAGEAHAHPGKNKFAGLSVEGQAENGGDGEENVDSGAAGNDKA
ncbi:hypothetical protein Ddc_09995 [Ditylenchus destructor]|nr:hypothetical protein Ddc_09995 [Ditylenchus destructor]